MSCHRSHYPFLAAFQQLDQTLALPFAYLPDSRPSDARRLRCASSLTSSCRPVSQSYAEATLPPSFGSWEDTAATFWPVLNPPTTRLLPTRSRRRLLLCFFVGRHATTHSTCACGQNWRVLKLYTHTHPHTTQYNTTHTHTQWKQFLDLTT